MLTRIWLVGDAVQFGTDWYHVVTVDKDKEQYLLKPDDSNDPVDQVWVDSADLQ